MSAVTESVSQAIRARHGGDAWGLYLDKLCFRPGEAGPPNSKESPKTQALHNVCEVYHRSAPSLQSAVDRGVAFRVLLADQYGVGNVRVVHLRSTSRLLLHLARTNPLENVGLYAERITGLPMVPGPAVKGVLSTWACWCQNIDPASGSFPETFATTRRAFDRAEAELAARVLGDNDPQGSKAGGEVVFLGGWPETVPTLELDITTPHPNEEKREGPIPNPFLAVAPGTDWAFVFVARPRGGADGKALLDQVEVWLKDALRDLGLGAKTAAGYGRFRELTEPEACELGRREGALRAKAEKDAAARAETEARMRAQAAAARAEAERRARLAPEDLAYEDFVKGVTDWTAPAREIATKTPEQKALILRFFRSPEGQALLDTWTNKKGQARIQNLKEAGL